MKNNMLLAENLTKLRKAYRKKQEYVANKCFVDRTAVSCWERGTRNPSDDALERLSGLYGVSVENLTSHKLDATYESTTEKVRIRVVDGEDPDIDYLPLVVDPIHTILTLPRMGVSLSIAYTKYKEALEIDREWDFLCEVFDDRILEAMDLYWYAYNHGVDEAGMNLLRIYFILILAANMHEKEGVETLLYLIEDEKDRGNSDVGDYYEALACMYSIFPQGDNQKENFEIGLSMMNSLAEKNNDYAIKALLNMR